MKIVVRSLWAKQYGLNIATIQTTGLRKAMHIRMLLFGIQVITKICSVWTKDMPGKLSDLMMQKVCIFKQQDQAIRICISWDSNIEILAKQELTRIPDIGRALNFPKFLIFASCVRTFHVVRQIIASF